MTSTNLNPRRRMLIFFGFAWLLGGASPAFIYVILDAALGDLLPSGSSQRTFLIAAGSGTFVVGLLLWLCLWLFEKQSPRAATFLAYIAAPISIIALHFVVRCTGGPIDSAFTFSYLFIPSAVALAFRPKLAVIFVSLVSLLSLYVNLFITTPYDNDPGAIGEWEAIVVGVPYKVVFLSVFLIQLGATVLIDVFTNNRSHGEFTQEIPKTATSTDEVPGTP